MNLFLKHVQEQEATAQQILQKYLRKKNGAHPPKNQRIDFLRLIYMLIKFCLVTLPKFRH